MKKYKPTEHSIKCMHIIMTEGDNGEYYDVKEVDAEMRVIKKRHHEEMLSFMRGYEAKIKELKDKLDLFKTYFKCTERISTIRKLKRKLVDIYLW